MHDTAFHIGTLAMNIYADLSTASILEVGSHAINGSLRDNALPTTNYIGLDLEEGDGVDIVIKPGIMPVDDNAFDLVIASSVFEHDPAFWTTFLEMCRKTKEGGYIYINAPSNGQVHRYPQDNWRFYPDSGAALVKWAVSQGQHVSLVESFIANRADDIWNDFVAVFRKGRITKNLPKTSLHENISCTNVMTWKTSEIINPSDRSEDMILLEQAREQAQAAKRSLAQASNSRDEAERQATQMRGERDDLLVRIADAELGVEQLSKKLQNSESLVVQLASQQQAAELVAEETRRKLEEERVHAERSARAQAEIMDQLHAANAKLTSAEAARQEAQRSVLASEARLDARFQEIATLTSLLRQQEHYAGASFGHVEWLRAVTGTLMSQPKWWALMPREWYLRRQRARLQGTGLFDCGAYLNRYPDVAAAGLDPLQHYLQHGLHEGRSRSF